MPSRFHVVDGTRSTEEVAHDVWTAVQKLIA
jgi:thymidylate kinase